MFVLCCVCRVCGLVGWLFFGVVGLLAVFFGVVGLLCCLCVAVLLNCVVVLLLC